MTLTDPNVGGNIACDMEYTWDSNMPTTCEIIPMTTDPPHCPVTYFCIGSDEGDLDDGCNKANHYSFDSTTAKFTLFVDIA